MKKRPTYQIFDGDEDEYTLKVTSNRNIYDVVSVFINTEGREMEERKYYALHGEIEPTKVTKSEAGERIAHYSFENIYSRSKLFDALAEQLFYGIEPLGEIDENGLYVIVDKERHERLLRSEVRRAFDDFMGEFGVLPYTDGEQSDMLSGSPIFQNLISALTERNSAEATEK